MKAFLVLFVSVVFIVSATFAIVGVEVDDRRQIQLSVGKKIKSINTSGKPCVIVFDDGSRLEFDCYKYTPRVKYSIGSE